MHKSPLQGSTSSPRVLNAMDQSLCVSDDVLVNVLAWVPAKSLCRFRCVSKSWRSLIDSSYFEKMCQDRHCSRLLVIPSMQYNRDICSLICDSTHVWQKKLELPLDKDDYSFLGIVGSCNGLICLTGTNIKTCSTEVHLWNPFRGEFRTLEHKRLGLTNEQYFVHGFGMDATTHDCKVVRITYWCGVQVRPTGAEIYTLSRDTWRSLGHERINFTCLALRNSRAFVNGVVYWLADPAEGARRTSISILSFNVAEEVFREIRLPVYELNLMLRGNRSLYLWLVVLQSKLALFACNVSSKKCSVWVMKEYGGAEYWSTLYDLSVIQPGVEIHACLGFIGDGQILFHLRNGKLVSCDADNMEFTEVGIYVRPHMREGIELWN